MKYVVRFDSDKIWLPEVIPVMDEYLQGKIRPDDAIVRLGWSKQNFLSSLGHVFGLLRQGYEGFSIKAEADMEGLYRILRALVSDRFKIEISDGSTPCVAIVPNSYETFPWTHFMGGSVEDALERAIAKLKNPGADYRDAPTTTDPEGYLWPADGESCYSEKHIKIFLRE